jgi:hypothetical protein
MLAKKIVAALAVLRIAPDPVLNMVCRAVLDLLPVNANPPFAVEASDIAGDDAVRHIGYDGLRPFVRSDTVAFEELLLLAPAHQQRIVHGPSSASGAPCSARRETKE